MRKELNPIFPELRIIKAIRFGARIMPFVAVMSVLTQMVFQNSQAMPQAIIIALFAISLTLQGIWWLGHRSEKLLPPGLISWYRELHHNILKTGFALEPMKSKPKYKELALILDRAFRQLDEDALERWF